MVISKDYTGRWNCKSHTFKNKLCYLNKHKVCWMIHDHIYFSQKLLNYFPVRLNHFFPSRNAWRHMLNASFQQFVSSAFYLYCSINNVVENLFIYWLIIHMYWLEIYIPIYYLLTTIFVFFLFLNWKNSLWWYMVWKYFFSVWIYI